MNEWKPNPKQEIALARNDFEILYGGARGGGKTDAGMAWLTYDIKNPEYRALVLRRNADDLRDWIDRAKIMFARVDGIAVGKPVEFRFPSGAIIRTGHLKDADAYTKYQGHEYHKILFEELTHIPSEQNYLKVLASCRSTVKGLDPQVFATTNPDGPGHNWVKERFRIPDWPDQNDIYESVDPKTKRPRVFVPAYVEDNPQLVENDPEYIAFLGGLPDGLREQWLQGSWEDFDIKGAYYTREIAQMKKEERIKLVPYDPKLPVYTVWDLGIGDNDSMAIGFWQRTKDKEMKLIHYYENNLYGLPHYVWYLQDISQKRQYVYGKHFAPHDAKKREKGTGKTFVQLAEDLKLNFEVIPMISVRDGILNTRLMFPRMYVSIPDGKQFLNAIKQYHKEYDQDRGIFKDSPYHDWTSHGADMLRYTAQVEEEMVIEVDEWEEPQAKAESEYEGGYEDDKKHPLLKGVDVGKM